MTLIRWNVFTNHPFSASDMQFSVLIDLRVGLGCSCVRTAPDMEPLAYSSQHGNQFNRKILLY